MHQNLKSTVINKQKSTGIGNMQNNNKKEIKSIGKANNTELFKLTVRL